MRYVKMILLFLFLSGSLAAADSASKAEEDDPPQCSFLRLVLANFGQAFSPFSGLADAFLEEAAKHATAEEQAELRRMQKEEELKKKKAQ